MLLVDSIFVLFCVRGALAEEELTLDQCLKELRHYEINNEIAIYKEYAAG